MRSGGGSSEVCSSELSGGVIIGALIIKFTGCYIADPSIAVLIGLWVLPRTWTLLRESGQVLMQGVPAGLDMEDVRAKFLPQPDVDAFHDLHAWALRSRAPLLTAHVVLAGAQVDAEHAGHSLTGMLGEVLAIHHDTLQLDSAP